MRVSGGVQFTPGSAGFEQIVSANPKRHSITLFCSNGASYLLTDSTTDPGTRGCLMPLNGTPLVLSEDVHGDFVKKSLYGRAVSGSVSIGFIECVNAEGL